eukprot:3316150-Amphidinium_carterae.1
MSALDEDRYNKKLPGKYRLFLEEQSVRSPDEVEPLCAHYKKDICARDIYGLLAAARRQYDTNPHAKTFAQAGHGIVMLILIILLIIIIIIIIIIIVVVVVVVV